MSKIPNLLVLLFLSTFANLCLSNSKNDSELPVLIVGAGMAGARAALELAKNNVPFVIFEATDQVGGRVKSTNLQSDIGAMKIEEGANYVQGFRRGIEFYDFVKREVNLTGISFDYDDQVFISNGTVLDDSVSEDAWSRWESALKAAYDEKSKLNKLNDKKFDDMSLEAALLYAGKWEPSNSLEYGLQRFEIDFEYAVPTSKISVRDLSSIYDPKAPTSDDIFVTDPRGFTSVVREVLKRSGINDTSSSGTKLRLNSPVDKITYSKYISAVTLRNGETIYGSSVISTVSLGVLQASILGKDSSRIKFDPPLPIAKKRAISKFTMGDYRKLTITFNYPILDENDALITVPLDCDESEILLILNLNKQGYYPNSNSIVVVATDSKGRELLCLDDEAALEKIIKFLTTTLGKEVTRKDVKAFHFSKYGSNEFFRGSFSIRTPGITERDVQELSEPIQSLFFAGEAHNEEQRGYVHSAWDSGKKCARDVIKFLKN